MTSYKDAGVNIDEGNAFIDLIKPFVNKTCRQNVLSQLGGFSGIYDVKFLKELNHPVLVSSTDGVGTKIEIARALNKFDTIGIDLVAMIVNDILVQGAEPMFFLDYYASCKLNKVEAAKVIEGVVTGCKIANCALIGGETAEMPGVYDDNKFDLAGCGVGFAEKDELLPKKKQIKKYDILVGMPSSGIHSNGYSLVRMLINNGFPLTEELLIPTHIYSCECLQTKELVKAFIHITGGGFIDNIPRVLPSSIKPIYFDWDMPYIFNEIQNYGRLTKQEMMRTFNCGFGMVAIIDPNNLVKFRSFVPESVIIGELREEE